MLNRKQIALIAALTCLAIAMAWFDRTTLQQVPSYRHASQTDAETQQGGKHHDSEAQSLWVPVDSVGLYTLVLAVFTGLLVGVSGVQGYFLLRADRTARIAANAAKRQADAAIGIELPIFLLLGGPAMQKGFAK
jgi:hypothetical protein